MTSSNIDANPLIGSWSLISYVSTSADGERVENFGQNPVGRAMFDEASGFSIIVMKNALPAFATGNRLTGSPEENMAVVQGSLAYFGTFSRDAIDDQSLIFHIKGATLPNWRGQIQRRGFIFTDEGELVLINKTSSGGGSAQIRWKRLS